ncbi:hypothetical protein JOM56_014353 [Amanita muscaria]
MNPAVNAAAAAVCDNIHHCRTILSIVNACASTIVLCCWTVLHLDVPDLFSPSPERFRSRDWLAACALVAPEAVLMLALCDWSNSSKLLRLVLGECRCHSNASNLKTSCTALEHPRAAACSWTEFHAHFACMGGFRYQGKSMYSLDLLDWIDRGEIDIPNISQAEILARTKGDYGTKLIAVTQIVWYISQSIHRWALGLLLAEFEITTLSHAIITPLIYFFWWYKPLGVVLPIDIPEATHHPAPQISEVEEMLHQQVAGPAEGTPPPQLSLYTRLGIKLYLVRQDLKDGNLNVLGRMILSITSIITAGYFGALHFLAWNSAFPTYAEELLWKGSSSLMTIIPATILVIAINGYEIHLFRFRISYSIERAVSACVVVYSFSRLILLILAFLQLRALPYAIYETPSWPSLHFIHIA